MTESIIHDGSIPAFVVVDTAVDIDGVMGGDDDRPAAGEST
jgi:hypothetical protein